jgi:hypothetical protein
VEEPLPDALDALPTALTGPPVASFRQASAALAFYAGEPSARARPGQLDRLLWGMGASFHAARLMVRDRALLRSALWPTALTLLGAVVAGGAVALRPRGIELETGDGGPSPRGLQAFLVTFVALASMPPTFLQRQWMGVAHEARRALGLPPGEDPFPGESYLTMLWREGRKAIRQAVVVSMGLLPVVIFIRLLPFGDAEATAVGAAWAFYWVVVDAFELPIEVLPGPRHPTPAPWYARALGWLGGLARPLRFFRWAGRMLERLTRPWGEEVRFTERHGWETAGFAAGVGLVLAIPVVGLFFRSVAITAATDLVGRLGHPLEGVPAGALTDATAPGPAPRAASAPASPG